MNNSLFEFTCNIHECITKEDIMELLPEWKTRIIEVSILPDKIPLLYLNFLIAATTTEGINEWLQKYQDKTKTTYSIRTTNKCTGTKVLFKRQLCCHHNTKGTHLYHQRTKNTNCPSKINITLRAVKKRKQGKDPADAEMPCRIILIATHNHGTESADALRFRRVGNSAKIKLLNLFNRGHSPATALESLKMDIVLNSGDLESSLSDRKFCPDYGYCHRLYVKLFKKKDDALELNNSKGYLLKRVDDFNKELGENSAGIFFRDSDSDYCICICPPMFRRVHEYMRSTTKVIFVDSSSINDQNKSKIIILFTQSECGDLPLGILIATAEYTDLIVMGLQHLQTMIGSVIFGGNVNDPPIFLINNSFSLRVALNVVWPKSDSYINTFQVLQSVWLWIIKQKNEIPDDKRFEFFLQFKAILQAEDEEECEINFEKAKNEAQTYPHYVKFIENYWENRTLWAVCFRKNVIESNDNFLRLAMQLFREKLFEKLKLFNVIQALDFFLTSYLLYYQKNLLDAACNQLRQNIWNRIINVPSEDTMEQIQNASDNLVLVPTDTDKNVYYIVNIDVLSCTCFQKSICKHSEWATFTLISGQNDITIDDIETLKAFYIIATGSEPSPEWLLEIYTAETNSKVNNEREETDEGEQEFEGQELEQEIEEEQQEPEEEQQEPEEEQELEKHQLIQLKEVHIEEQEDCSQLVLVGQTMIQDIASQFNNFLESYPETILPVLYELNEKIKIIDNTHEFISSCKAFIKARSGIKRRSDGSFVNK